VRVAIAREDLAPWQLEAAQTIVRAGGAVVESGPDSGHRDPDRHPYLHAKAIVVDGIAAFVGSENLSTGSLSHNRELGVIVGDPHQIAKIEAAFAYDFAAGMPLSGL
jgi:phosphatidylserine/phosphatidylglycerophosphate/cardiolipin synthase-like enzyme